MKLTRKLVSVALCALLLLPLGIFSHAEQPGAQKLVVLGDSIAFGEGASDPQKAFAPLLAASMGYELSNFGVQGLASAGLLEILTQDDAVRVAITHADIIDLSIGGNDLLQSTVISALLKTLVNDFSMIDELLAAFTVNYSAIIAEIRSLNPDAMLIVQSLYNPMNGLFVVGSAYERVLALLNTCYADYLTANPGAYVIANVHDAFLSEEGLVARDRIHPSDAGHALIAAVLENTIHGTETVLPPLAGESLPKQLISFCYALVDYLSYWLTMMSLPELIGKVISFI